MNWPGPRFLPERLGVCRPTDPDAGIVKTALLRVTLQRQLAERRPGAGAVGKAQIQMRIEINNAHFFAREGVQYPSAVAEGRLVAAAQDQRAFTRPLTVGHRLAQRLMRGF